MHMCVVGACTCSPCTVPYKRRYMRWNVTRTSVKSFCSAGKVIAAKKKVGIVLLYRLRVQAWTCRHAYHSCSESPTVADSRSASPEYRHTKRFFVTGQLRTMALRCVGWCGLGFKFSMIFFIARNQLVNYFHSVEPLALQDDCHLKRMAATPAAWSSTL